MGAKLHFKLEEVQPLWLSTVSTGSPSPYLVALTDHNGTKASGKDGTYVVAATKNDAVPNTKNAQEIVSAFERTFQPGCEVSFYLSHDWATDPYSKGLWSAYRSEGMAHHISALQQPHGLIFFASADWAKGWRSFIDGALESGKKAARSINTLLNGCESRINL
jgi:lysyl oxidase-like protein 2/3/4